MSIQTAEDKAGIRLARVPRLTLVEAVVVLALLLITGSLAVPGVALTPPLASPSAAVRALGGDLSVQSARAHALWLAEGRPPAVSVDGRTVPMRHGYPVRAAVDDLLPAPEGFRFDPANGEFARLRASGRPDIGCTVHYTAPTRGGEAPGIRLDVSGC
jgi:hypothetical protein